MSPEDKFVLYAAGDVGSARQDASSLFRSWQNQLKGSAMAFCQLEVIISSNGQLLPQARLSSRAFPEFARVLKEAGFNIISVAGNHCLDWGYEAFSDTIDYLRDAQINVIGGGDDIDIARKPAIIEHNGTRIAFLAYNSILPPGYWATAGRAGCVPLRVRTFYEPLEPDQPCSASRTYGLPDRGDMASMIADIKKARLGADIVVVSMHWGIHMVPRTIAEYQKEIAHIAIDSGADIILGHHAHILKGIEVYHKKVIFYSLGNFALDLPLPKGVSSSPDFKELQRTLGWKPDPRSPEVPFPVDSRKTIMVKCQISSKRIQKVSFLPAYINHRFEPKMLIPADKKFTEVAEYVANISHDQGLDTKFTMENNELVIQVSP